MTEIFNTQEKINFRRKLRTEMTSAETVLWKRIRKRQINNYRFRRQVGVGSFTVDFYCPELKLVIEVDGANHFFDKESEGYDNQRQKYLEDLGLRVLRFTNTDIYHNLNDVLETIYSFIK